MGIQYSFVSHVFLAFLLDFLIAWPGYSRGCKYLKDLWQKPAFGGFGSTSTQSSPFGSGFQPTQPAFGSSLFGSTPAFGTASTPAFGPTSTLAFGATSTAAFGPTSTAAFGATSIPAFGTTTTLAFGAASTPAFGTTTTPAFGSTSTPAFGSTTTAAFGSMGTGFGLSSTPAFGALSTPLFGSSGIPAFGSSSNPAFGSPSTPIFGSSSLFGGSSSPSFSFGTSSSSSFSFGSAPASGQSSSAFGSSSPFGSTFSFGVQSSPFGSQTTPPTFGSPGFGQSSFSSQHGGSRITAYTPTTEVDSGSSTQPAGKLESISAMPAYKDKSHEELRWEDYQRGDKGGSSNQPAVGIFSAPTQPNLFVPTGTFGQPAANPFPSSASSNPFTPKTPTFSASGFGGSSSPALNSPFGTSFAPSTPGFGISSSPAPFGSAGMPAFSSSSLPFSSASVPGTSPFGSIFSTQSPGLFQSSVPPLGQISGFGSTPLFGSTNLFNVPSTGFSGNLFASNSSSSLFSTSNPLGFGTTTSTLSSAFQPVAPAQTSGLFSNFSVPMAAPSGGTSNVSGLAYFGQPVANQNNVGVQLLPVTNPFGTLPAMPQLFIGRGVSSPSVQYGIASMHVGDKPTLRVSSLFKPRHLSQRRINRVSKYHPKDALKAPFYSEYEEIPSTPNAGAFFVPRENPRALVILPVDQWPRRSSAEKQSPLKETDQSVQTNAENQSKNVCNGKKENASSVKPASKANATREDHTHNMDSFVTMSGHRADESAIVCEFGADIEALMPKLRHSDYYTEPQIQELAAKERAEPGSRCRVKNFVVGRHGYGSIKFFGETDIRHLDLESLVQFNNREVIVYMDENKKPPIGQGLNKPAEVTLLNVKCINKKTGEQYIDGPKVERYKGMLMKKTQEQGAKFVSFDAVKGEWKFKVDHFSHYELTDNP
ncbi:hypothetical protein ACLOJK_015802 [Asimina triloba]